MSTNDYTHTAKVTCGKCGTKSPRFSLMESATAILCQGCREHIDLVLGGEDPEDPIIWCPYCDEEHEFSEYLEESEETNWRLFRHGFLSGLGYHRRINMVSMELIRGYYLEIMKGDDDAIEGKN